MDRRWSYYKGENDKEYNIQGMKKYLVQKQEIDKVLEKMVTPIIENKNLKVIDACCGIGHITHLLSKINSDSKFLGVDQTKYLLDEAKDLCKENKNISFELADIYDLNNKYPKEFDISISWKTLSWLPHYDQMLKTLFEITKKHIFLSSLFYDGDIDFEIKAREYQKEAGKKDFNAYYNIYSLPQFKKFAYNLGAKNIQVQDFNIDLDIPQDDINKLGTYTVKTENGKKMQFSGAVWMPWKIIRIDL